LDNIRNRGEFFCKNRIQAEHLMNRVVHEDRL
jgi:hypothetical protein